MTPVKPPRVRSFRERITGRLAFLSRPAGPVVVLLLGALIALAPVWLFADSVAYSRLFMDDFPYIMGSRDFPTTLEHLFTPHNTHVVPAWRVLTWLIVESAGSLAGIPWIFGWAALGVVPVVMTAVGVLVGRDTRRTSAGLIAMGATGITSILRLSATWYSASQTLWAGLGVLLSLLALQGWRRSGGGWRLAVAAIWVMVAGWFWTIGHVAGPAGAAYLLADGSPRARKAAIVPLLATMTSLVLSFALGASQLKVEIRFQGTDNEKPINFVRGASHTLQSISETIVLGNLGVASVTSPGQAAVLTFAIVGLWAWTFRNGGRITPLEAAGAVIVGVGYLVSWSFRGYYEFINLRGIVPWYDTIPHLGAVLFASGWWGRVWNPACVPSPLTRWGVLGVGAVSLGLVVVHQPRATQFFVDAPPKMTEAEARVFPLPELKRFRALVFLEILSKWQRAHLYQLEQAERVASRNGIGRDLIHKVFGRLHTPNLSNDYDALDLLKIPDRGTETNEERCRVLLGKFFAVPPEPKFPLEEVLKAGR